MIHTPLGKIDQLPSGKWLGYLEIGPRTDAEGPIWPIAQIEGRTREQLMQRMLAEARFQSEASLAAPDLPVVVRKREQDLSRGRRGGERMSHTPGPWEISLREMLDGWVIVVDRDGGIVANVNTETGPNIPPLVPRKMPAGANAALIAAAPDLLRELERLENQSGLPLERDDPARVAARTAIRKARGEE